MRHMIPNRVTYPSCRLDTPETCGCFIPDHRALPSGQVADGGWLVACRCLVLAFVVAKVVSGGLSFPTLSRDRLLGSTRLSARVPRTCDLTLHESLRFPQCLRKQARIERESTGQWAAQLVTCCALLDFRFFRCCRLRAPATRNRRPTSPSHRHDRPEPHAAHQRAARPEHAVLLSRTVTKNVCPGKHHGWGKPHRRGKERGRSARPRAHAIRGLPVDCSHDQRSGQALVEVSGGVARYAAAHPFCGCGSHLACVPLGTAG
jgi:hypothetical protein